VARSLPTEPTCVGKSHSFGFEEISNFITKQKEEGYIKNR